ncbi:MAG: hypothetical protein WBD75_13230 [Phycisphaerae bacterium]
MRCARIAAVVAAALMLIAPGCQNTRDAVPAGEGGPRSALRQWHQALLRGDRAEYLASFAGTEEELVLALAIFDAVQVNYRFYNAVVAKYGADAWKAFEGAGAARVHLWPRDPGWTATITVVRTGDFAVGYLPRARVPMHLREDGGRWRIDAASLIPPGQTAEKAAYYLFRWSAALRELAQRVGRPGEPAAPLRPDAPRGALEEKLEAGELKQADEAIHYMMMH